MSDASSGGLGARELALLRDLTPSVLATVVRRYRDFGAAEDAVQEAALAAFRQWPESGVPENPHAWLVRVATRRLTDEVRAAAARRHRERLVVSLVPMEDQLALAADEAAMAERDETLELLFMCCHPSLTMPSAIALTLRAVGGLTTAEIARAFLVPEATMAQRLSRAKQTIKTSSVAIERLEASEVGSRLAAVLEVVYLIFNEGYAATEGEHVERVDLAEEALRLMRLVYRMASERPEVEGLLALMLLTHARRAARTGPTGELVPLDLQDRSRWDRAAIDEGTALLRSALARSAIGPYQLHAAIAALHDEAPSTDETDWPQILALYDVLVRLTGNPMARLSRIVALAMVEGPTAGLAALDTLDASLVENHRVIAVRAHLLEKRGDFELAIEQYQRAAARTTSTAERRHLLLQAGKLIAQRSSPGE